MNTMSSATGNGTLTAPVRGNYFAETTYAKTNVRQGVTRTPGGTRLVALSPDFLLGLRRAVRDECGPAADTVFYTCGVRWGELFAKRMEGELSDHYKQSLSTFSVAMFEGCLSELFSHHGWGKLKLDLGRHGEGLIQAKVKHCMMAELVGDSDVPTDSLLAGILAGFFRYLTGQDLGCVQTSCEACGSDVSSFILGLQSRLTGVPSWVENGRSHDEIVDALADVRAKD
ncbi:MAG: V4R domain-containing protein [Gemmataceae bacterium]